jgi:hypothetical protein
MLRRHAAAGAGRLLRLVLLVLLPQIGGMILMMVGSAKAKPGARGCS